MSYVFLMFFCIFRTLFGLKNSISLAMSLLGVALVYPSSTLNVHLSLALRRLEASLMACQR
jgi:hypothetical protein